MINDKEERSGYPIQYKLNLRFNRKDRVKKLLCHMLVTVR